jgi:hypothetical protein
MILFLKSLDGAGDKIPIQEKLVLIFKERVKQAKTDKDRERAERDLAEFQAGAGAE